MERYLLDTTPLIAYMKGRPTVVSLLAPLLARREVATSGFVYAEATEHNISFADYERRQGDLRRLMREVTPYVLTYSILDRYAAVRRRLTPPHGSDLIGDIDTPIAATSLGHDLTLITTDSDFQRVPELKLMLLPRRT